MQIFFFFLNICLHIFPGKTINNIHSFPVRLQSLHGELEHSKQREGKLIEDNRQLSEKVSTLEKECASLGLELKAIQNRYQQEVRAHEETERSRLVSKEEANIELVKGEPIIIIIIIIIIKSVAYSSQGNYTGQLDFCNSLTDTSM